MWPLGPKELSSIALFWNVPPEEPFPPEHHGKPVVIVACVYSGSVEEGEPVVKPLRELAEPLIDLSGPWPWLGLQAGFDALYPKGASTTGSRGLSPSSPTRQSTTSPTGRPAVRPRSPTSSSGITAVL
jgi:hypothetical protein